jgi:beta-lactam-binding protein with PASTA domain
MRDNVRTSIVVVALLLYAVPARAQIRRTPADSARIVDRARALAMVEMPSVVDRSLEEAQQACRAVRLRPTAVRIGGGDPAPDDIVVRQRPQPKQVVSIRTVCELAVRPRPQEVQLTPNVLGLPRRVAETILFNRAKLRPSVTTVPSPDTALGSVVAQNPLPDTPTRPDRTVDLQVAGVPRVVGLSVDAATARLERVRLTGTTMIRELTEGSDGTVVEQSPEAGQPAESGSSVALTVVRVVERQFAMPDLIGRPIDEARRVIADSGLVLQRLEIATAEGRPDTAVGQSPAAGSLVRRGDAVTLTNGRPITVVAPQLSSLRIEPDSVSIAVRDSVRLSVVGVMSDGSLTAVTPAWTASTGSIASDGRYVATGASGRVVVTATFNGLAATSVIRVEPMAPPPPPPSSWPWWWIPAIAAVVAALGWGAWRLLARPDPPTTPPSTPPPVPPLAFTYDVEAPSVETEITATHGHGSSLSLVSHAGESDHAIEPEGVELFNAESTHG